MSSTPTPITTPTVTELSQEQIDQFHRDGYLVIDGFVPADTVSALKAEIREIVEHDFHPEDLDALSVFSTDDNDKQKKHNSDVYFIESSDKIRFFLEKDADVKGLLSQQQENNKDSSSSSSSSKLHAINKVAHSLHDKNDLFRHFSFHPVFKRFMEQLVDAQDPRIVQSMWIFKNPRVGGVVTPHQDLTFLHVSNGSLIGFWMAMDDATKENGCLWGWPGSHKRGLATRMVRKEDGSTDSEFVTLQPEFDFWNDAKYADQYKPLEVKAGGLVLLHGTTVHKSSHNHSDKSREAYTFHCMDMHGENGTGNVYSRQNWLQRADGFPDYWENNK